MALRSDKVILSLSSSLQGHSDFPMSLTAPYGVYPACALLTTAGIQWKHWDLRSNTRTLSPHATGLTPGPPQVLMPFTSLWTMAFSIVVEDRRIACCKQVYPAPRLSQLYPSGVSLRGCTIRFMLRPAALAGIPDWVKPIPLRI